MRYRKLDADGDYSFGSGQADFYRDVPEAPAQAVGTRLRLWTGEWFLDLAEGTPYRTEVLGKYTSKIYAPVLRARVLDTIGVTAITRFSSVVDPDTRRLTVQGEIDTVYGVTPIIETR